MAEDEIARHTKKIFKLWRSKEHPFWHKVKEFLLEVLIIVFAISVSLWFHNNSEHTHQQEDVKQFLLGLKEDLTHDIKEMEDDRKSYLLQQATFSYITSVRMNEQLNMDSLLKYKNWLYNTTALNPNNGRFEGFKSSGKIGEIENRELQNDIMDLYQEDIVALLASTENYTTIKKTLFDYLNKNKKRVTDLTSNIGTVLMQDEAQNICASLSSPGQLIGRYDTCIDKAKKIIAEINEEYQIKQ